MHNVPDKLHFQSIYILQVLRRNVMKRIGQLLFIIMFLGIIFTMPILTKLQKNENISQFENRRLAVVPVATAQSLISGKYFSQWDTYLADHIFYRNKWIKTYTYMNMYILDKLKINNIVIGKDRYLLPFYSYSTKYDAAAHKAKIEIMAAQMEELMKHIQKNGGSFYFVGIPEQSSFYKDKYPEYFYNNQELTENAEKFMFASLDGYGVPYIDMNRVYRENMQVEYYSKTDHHYNFEGAYTAYKEIMKRLIKDGRLPGISSKDEFNIVTLSNPFAGSRNRQIYNLYPSDEKVQLALPKEQIVYEKYTNGRPDPNFYFYNINSQVPVNYGVYMGGDWAETVIKTNRKGLPNLLVFGDSFTNALEPLLYEHFNETRILDLRHYKDMSLYEYVDKYKPDVVIMVRDDLSYAGLTGNGNFTGENIK